MIQGAQRSLPRRCIHEVGRERFVIVNKGALHLLGAASCILRTPYQTMISFWGLPNFPFHTLFNKFLPSDCTAMEYLPSFPDATFYLATLGATVAAFKHFFSPLEVVKTLTPAGLTTKDGKEDVLPAVRWWASPAFAIMNASFALQGAWAHYHRSQLGKRGVLLSTSVMFFMFSAAWAQQGTITGNPGRLTMAAKTAFFGGLFAAGFVLMPAE